MELVGKRGSKGTPMRADPEKNMFWGTFKFKRPESVQRASFRRKFQLERGIDTIQLQPWLGAPST